MPKILKIILTILLIIAIILVLVWFRSRRAAVQQGQPAPSFREFLGLGSATPKQQPATPGTGLTSDFTTPSDTISGTTAGNTDDTTNSGSTTTSQFTSGPISPTQGNNTGSATTPSSNGGKSTGNTGGGVTGTGGKITVIPAPSGGSAPGAVTDTSSSQCTDADVTIQFTADEVNRLNELQNRFYAIAGVLHTDADVQNEIANHDEFKAKVDQITELYNYCVAKAPLITAPLYATRITTPFYRDPARDGNGYISGKINGWSWIQLDSQNWDPREVPLGQGLVEQILKVNLW